MKKFSLKTVFRRKIKSEIILGFDENFYKNEYTDVASSGLSPKDHYIHIGLKEHRNPNKYFNVKGYRSANPDILKLNKDSFEHFVLFGLAEGRLGWRPEDQSVLTYDAQPEKTSGGISAWTSDFQNFIRASIVDMESRSTADPNDIALKSYLEYSWFHEARWNMTFRIMAPYIEQSGKIIEIGGRSAILSYLLQRGMKISETKSDLRGKIAELENEQCDAILCLEVLEHIKDQDGSIPIDVFNESGIKMLLTEMWRALKCGGIVVCTTPNGCSYTAIARAVAMEPPMFFRKHVREFTPDELRESFDAAGFETVFLETPKDPWGLRTDLDYPAVKALVARSGASQRWREDDIVGIFRKR